jgi:hypothetical protein
MWLIFVAFPIIAVVAFGLTIWFYWHGDILRAIFWLIVFLASYRMAVAVSNEQ